MNNIHQIIRLDSLQLKPVYQFNSIAVRLALLWFNDKRLNDPCKNFLIFLQKNFLIFCSKKQPVTKFKVRMI